MRIQLLGPVRAWRGSDELPLGGPKQRAVLALLAAATGNPVSSTELIDALWEDPPASAHNVVQTYLKRLRRLLEPDRDRYAPSRFIDRAAGGHALRVSDVDLDLTRFRELVGAAAAADRDGDTGAAAGRWGEALGLWRGEPLANTGLAGIHPRVVALAGERRAAVASYGEAMLALGRPAEALAVLAESAAAGPLDEAAHALLIRGYHMAGNRGEAFAAYHAIRDRLAEELGVDPGPELAAAHLALLRDERSAAAGPPAADKPAGGAAPTPAQLPWATAAFAGRAEQLRQLDKLVSLRDAGAAALVVAIVGPAGIGKTTLAVHWAHQLADRFPDGQLYADLRGFDRSGAVTSPAEALRGFLDALAVPAQRVPASVEAQVGLYRSLLAGRRMLIVLDNARDADQVRPLLPGTPGCLVVVTSRDQLTGLVAGEGAHLVTLDLLSPAEAGELLANRLGHDRVVAEPDAVAEIIGRCDRLPLALAIVAARGVTRPAFPLAAFAAELRATASGLDALDGGDAGTTVRTVFSWSYHVLSPPAARLFRLLGLHPGTDLGMPAVASLAGVPVPEVRAAVAELTGAHLLAEHVPGRYTRHDLLRAYAAELVETVDSDDDRRAALTRMYDHYLHSAHAATLLIQPDQAPLDSVPDPLAVIERVGEQRAAVAWFIAEHEAILTTIRQAAGTGFPRHTMELALASAAFLQLRARWRELLAVCTLAFAAAERLADQRSLAHIHRVLARAQVWLSRSDLARDHFQRACEIYRRLGDQVGEADVYNGLSWLAGVEHRVDDAVVCSRRAAALYRAAGRDARYAAALSGLGWHEALRGNFHEAITACREALPVLQRAGSTVSEAHVWDTLGYAYHHLGDFQVAGRCYQRALVLLRGIGDLYNEASILDHIGDNEYAVGRLPAARQAWQQALAILDRIANPDADQVRGKLAGLDQPERTPVAASC